MFEAVITTLSLVSIVLSACFIVFLYKFKAGLPDFQQIFDEFGEGMGSTISALVKDPMVSRAMSTLGKKSGDVRANTALKNKVATKLVGQNLLLKKGLEYLGISPFEGLELMSDPTMGPMIQNVMGMLQKGAGKALGGFGGGGSRPPGRNHAIIYGREE